MKIFDVIKGEMDAGRLVDNTGKLWKIELGQCHKNYRDSAVFVEGLLKESGLDRVERIPFPVDGETVYQDATMPLCWEVSLGKLTVKKSPVPFAEPAVADFGRHPFHLVKGSVSTPREARSPGC